MFLFTSKGKENIPKGAVIVSEKEAIAHQRDIVRDWDKESQVIFLRYGSHMSMGLVLASTVAIVKHFREQFRMGNRFALITYVPISLLSFILYHKKFDERITNNILIMKMKCPLCSQIRCACEQAFAGIVYPTITSAVLLSFTADKLKSMHVPDIGTDAKEYFRLIFKFCRAGATKYQVITALHGFSVLFLPYMQSLEFNKIMKIYYEKENSALNS